MIDGLIAGRVAGAPQKRTAKTGREFVTFRLKVPTDGGDAVFANCIVFAESAQAAVLALAEGDAASVAGSVKPTAWIDKEGAPRAGLDVVVQSLLTAYSIEKRRRATQGQDGGQQGAHRDRPASGRQRPSDEAWRAAAPAGREQPDYSGLDHGADLPF